MRAARRLRIVMGAMARAMVKAGRMSECSWESRVPPVPADREPAELDAEDDEQDDAEPEGRHAEAHERHDAHDVVRQPVPPDRRRRRQRQRDEHREEGGQKQESEGRRKAVRDDVEPPGRRT